MNHWPKIDLINYGGGNLGSITRCLERLETPYRIISSTAEPLSGDNPILFPGVGAFGPAMDNLTKSGLAQRIRESVRAGTPYLGICIGLQVLFESGEEAPGIPGLGLLPGSVVRFKQGKIPQIGWNWIKPQTEAQSDAWPSGYVYFVNSYHPAPADPEISLYQADYHGQFCAAVQQDNITAFQFHPEKSGEFGLQLMRRWLENVA
ncbi:MAG TPA: imidazole glycerol phosphate synthase subunit HisH [Coleofasciculaceae cyanobacterium]|jgi:imidazole glycerol phosphate synthase glutamine amidotransferase subunit